MQYQNFTVRQRQLVQQIHKFSFLFAPDKQVVRAVFEFIQRFGNFIEQNFPSFAPALGASLVRDTEEPAPELRNFTQASNMFDGGDERLLHEVEAGLFVADEFKNLNIKWQLVSPEERVPSRRFPGTGLRHGQLFDFGHFRHCHQVECARRAKVQSESK